MEETAKEILKKAIDDLPDDSTTEEIIKELLFHQMIERGLKDADEGRVISHEEMGARIKSWAAK